MNKKFFKINAKALVKILSHMWVFFLERLIIYNLSSFEDRSSICKIDPKFDFLLWIVAHHTLPLFILDQLKLCLYLFYFYVLV